VATILAGRTDASPVGLALAACLNAVNSFANYVAWVEVRAAERAGHSVIMRAQLRTRTTKLVASALVQITLTVAAVTAEPVIAAWADALGALIVAGFIARTSARMMREGLPDLLDRAVDEATREAAVRALEPHRPAFAELGRIRSRRAGGAVFLELAVRFDADLPLEEVDRRIEAMRAAIEAGVPGADVAILPWTQFAESG
jgi:divalent metal cation (Fe/Co/Zn/Cd) transporter